MSDQNLDDVLERLEGAYEQYDKLKADPNMLSTGDGNYINLPPRLLQEMILRIVSPVGAGGKPKPMGVPLIWGPPGIGKTDIVRQIADHLGLRLVPLHLGQYDPTDLKGIPVNVNGTVRWYPSSFLPVSISQRVSIDETTTMLSVPVRMDYATDVTVRIFNEKNEQVVRFNEPMVANQVPKDSNFQIDGNTDYTEQVVLSFTRGSFPKGRYRVEIDDLALVFLDEISTAPTMVQNAALQLCLDRRIAEYDLPITTPIICAGNGENDGAFIQPLSAPLANRLFHVGMVPSVDDFVDYAMKTDVDPSIIAFIRNAGQPALFNIADAINQETPKGFPTPRSWVKLSEQLRGQFGDGSDMTELLVRPLVQGYVGPKVAHDYLIYRDTISKLPAALDILDGKIKTKDAYDRIMKVSGAAALFYVNMVLAQRLGDTYNEYKDSARTVKEHANILITRFENWCGFLCHLDQEFQILGFHLILRNTGDTPLAMRAKSGIKLFGANFVQLAPVLLKLTQRLSKNS